MVAVNVTISLGQIEALEAAILIVGLTDVLTVITTLFDSPVAGEAQVLELVIIA